MPYLNIKMVSLPKKRGLFIQALAQPILYPAALSRDCKSFSAIASFLHQVVELKIIDAIVDAIGRSVFVIGRVFRISQDGNLTSMLRFMVAGVLILLAFVAFFGR